MAKFETRLSLASLDEMIKRLEIKKKSYPKVALRIADRLADIMMDCDLQSGTYKEPTRLEENTAIASIKNDEKKAQFQEFGTGIIGSQFPHVAEELQRMGWKYDVNGHGEKGWWYPTTENDPNPHKWTDESGQLRAWTKGLPAGRYFYNALKRAEEMFSEVAIEELEREAGK